MCDAVLAVTQQVISVLKTISTVVDLLLLFGCIECFVFFILLLWKWKNDWKEKWLKVATDKQWWVFQLFFNISYQVKCYLIRNESFWIRKTNEATLTSERPIYKFVKEEDKGLLVTLRKVINSLYCLYSIKQTGLKKLMNM